MGEFIKVGTRDDVAPGRPLVCDIEYDTFAIFQVGQAYYCVEDCCTHQEYPLSEGVVEECKVECPLHGSWFDLVTGKALNLPAFRAVRTLAVKVEGNDIYIESPE